MSEKKDVYTIEMRMITTKEDDEFLKTRLDVYNRLYNIILRYCKNNLIDMRNDPKYQKARSNYNFANRELKRIEFKNRNLTESAEKSLKRHLKKQQRRKDIYLKKLNRLRSKYCLTEFSMWPYARDIRNKCFYKGIPANSVQNMIRGLNRTISKHLYEGSKLRFKKNGSSNSFWGKTNERDIIVNTKTFSTVKVMGRVITLKSVRDKDFYLQEALQDKVKYCIVVRKPFKNKDKYFLQIVFEGESPKKLSLGKGICGLDPGTSTIAYCNDNETQFKLLAPNVEKYDKQLRILTRTFERRQRLCNPGCYDDNDTIIKGCRLINKTKGMLKIQQQLKATYRLKSEYIRQFNNYYVNRIVESCDTVITEPMDFVALAKRSKKPNTKVEKSTTIINKRTGKIRTVKKFKRKKRFGASINRRAPGQFKTRLKEQMLKYSGKLIEIDIHAYKASQYDHITKIAIKPKLSDRSKIVGGCLVQRDLYSAFLLRNYKDTKTIDFDKCVKDYNSFLQKQDVTIKEIKDKLISNPKYRYSVEYTNFGIKL